MTKEDILKLYIQSSLNIPYIWGGNNPFQGFDCSGYIQYLLEPLGLDPKWDQNSQMLYDYFNKEGDKVKKPKFGNLLFFGRSTKRITHIAMAISGEFMVEAGGGGSKNKTVDDARKNGAATRIRPISRRKDLLSIIKIKEL